MSSVTFVDTSILCNLLPVPGRDQDRAEVLAKLKELGEVRTTMILPMTAVVETGNFIAQLEDGRVRRTVAGQFDELLRMISADQAPWKLNEVAWNAQFLSDLRAGGGTGSTLVEQMQSKVGGGDLCILTERMQFVKRSSLTDVTIWTADAGLAAHS